MRSSSFSFRSGFRFTPYETYGNPYDISGGLTISSFRYPPPFFFFFLFPFFPLAGLTWGDVSWMGMSFVPFWSPFRSPLLPPATDGEKSNTEQELTFRMEFSLGRVWGGGEMRKRKMKEKEGGSFQSERNHIRICKCATTCVSVCRGWVSAVTAVDGSRIPTFQLSNHSI